MNESIRNIAIAVLILCAAFGAGYYTATRGASQELRNIKRELTAQAIAHREAIEAAQRAESKITELEGNLDKRQAELKAAKKNNRELGESLRERERIIQELAGGNTESTEAIKNIRELEQESAKIIEQLQAEYMD